MLKSVQINNFRTCHGTNFKLNSSISALIGQNGAGKSNILQAIDAIGVLIRGEKKSKKFEFVDISVEFDINKKNYKYTITKNFTKERKEIIIDSLISLDDDKIIFKKDGSVVTFKNKKFDILPETPTIYLLNSLSDDSTIKNIYNFLSSMKYYHTHGTETELIFIDKKEFEDWKINPETDIENKPLIAYKIVDLFINNKETFNEVESMLIDLKLVSKIIVQQMSSPRAEKEKEEFILVYFMINNEPRFVNQLSEGTKRVINLLLNLFYDKTSLMLIEEPESSIHFGLMKKIVDIFRVYSDQHQILFSTHSSQVLDKLKPNELIFIRMEKNKTIAKNPTPKQIREINNFLNGTGPLGDYITTTGGDNP